MDSRAFLFGFLLVFSVFSKAVLNSNITFGGQAYIERWSDDRQQEYTPSNQPDPERSTEMLKVHRFPSINEHSQLVNLAQALQDHYQQAGDIIIESHAITNLKQKVSEQFMVVVSGTDTQLQAQFIRLTFVAGEAMAIVFSKRFDAEKDYDGVRVWLDKYGQESERNLRSWAEPF